MNGNTKYANKRGYSSMKDLISKGHRIEKGGCINTARKPGKNPWRFGLSNVRPNPEDMRGGHI